MRPPGRSQQAVKLANLPDLIRGYEEVKLKNVARFRQAVNDLKLETISETAPLQV
jgi:indolepyruvate ferredoxin oxidoreductase